MGDLPEAHHGIATKRKRSFVLMLGHVQLFASPWTVAHQAPLPMDFFRQECWSGLPFPTPGDLPNQGIELLSLVSPALADRFFTTMPPGKAETRILDRKEHMSVYLSLLNYI